MPPSSAKPSNPDRNIVLLFAGAVVLVIVIALVFGPHADDNPQPTIDNSGTHGIEAAYLLAQSLGYNARRWDEPLANLKDVDAAHTTLVLASPILPVRTLHNTQADIESFLKRGGRVFATGASGARLLPNGKTAASSHLATDLCYTRPEGPGQLARAGKVEIDDPVRWDANGPEFRVEQRCGNDAVVVRYPYGAGEVIWWSSPSPLTNAGIKNDPSLDLVLATFGPVSPANDAAKPRTILFDEYLHEERESLGDLLSGLPWWPLAWQSLAVAILLVVSFSRRNGPIRLPLIVPRTSPLEFADSMGRLYLTANAVEVPLATARAQMLRYLAETCGLSHALLRQPPEAIAEALSARIGGDWAALAEHLQAAARPGENAPTGKLALKLVQALERDREAIARQVSAARTSSGDKVNTREPGAQIE